MECCNCGAPADHLHHIVPRAAGGSDRPSNLAPLCGACHGLVHGLPLKNHRELTKQGLAKAKARGVKLGGRREAAIAASRGRHTGALERAEAMRALVEPMVEAGKSLRQMADALNAAGHKTERGSAWSHKTVGRVVQRLAAQ